VRRAGGQSGQAAGRRLDKKGELRLKRFSHVSCHVKTPQGNSNLVSTLFNKGSKLAKRVLIVFNTLICMLCGLDDQAEGHANAQCDDVRCIYSSIQNAFWGRNYQLQERPR
jgi:hypothetical protein